MINIKKSFLNCITKRVTQRSVERAILSIFLRNKEINMDKLRDI